MRIKFIGKCLLIESSREKKERILVVGDLHLGYEESLNESGVLVTRQLFREMIGELDEVFGEIERENRKEERERNGEVGSGGKNERVVNIKDEIGVEGLGVNEDIDVINKERGERIGGGEGGEKIVDKIVLLGDVKHVFSKNIRQEWNDVLELFDYFFGKMGGGEIVVTRGNHDNYLKTIAGKRNVKVEDYIIIGDVGFLHGDRVIGEVAGNKKIKKIIMGHFHPAVNLSDGNKIEKYKCFLEGKWKGKEIIVAPSFSEYSEGSDLRGSGESDWGFKFEKFNVKIVGENLEVWDFGKLGKV